MTAFALRVLVLPWSPFPMQPRTRTASDPSERPPPRSPAAWSRIAARFAGAQTESERRRLQFGN